VPDQIDSDVFPGSLREFPRLLGGNPRRLATLSDYRGQVVNELFFLPSLASRSQASTGWAPLTCRISVNTP
jgi:hypothetical protein